MKTNKTRVLTVTWAEDMKMGRDMMVCPGQEAADVEAMVVVCEVSDA